METSIEYQTMRYLDDLRSRNYTESTISSRARDLRIFHRWCDEWNIESVQDIEALALERYRREIFHHRKSNGEGLAPSTRYERIATVRLFCRWLAHDRILDHDPASRLELPRMEKRLPRQIPTPGEVERILRVPDLRDRLGIRDRTILEVLWSTGVRRSELIHLDVRDLDLERGALMVRRGKGRRDRIIPLGARACAWIIVYLRDVRPGLCEEGDTSGALFLAHRGRRFTPDFLSKRVREYIDAAKIGRTGSCHLFRHAMATAMLENGADIRVIQRMLGHASLTSTQIYAHVSVRYLERVHSETHPGTALSRKVEDEIEEARTADPLPRRNRRSLTLNRWFDEKDLG